HEPVPVCAADGDAGVVLQDGHELAVKPRLDCADSVHIHDRSAMHAHECRRVEPVGESVEAAAYLVGHRAGVDDHMIVGGLQPVDLVGADRHDATLVPHEYATQGGAGALLAL